MTKFLPERPGCFASRARAMWTQSVRQNNPTGKSANPVHPFREKYSASLGGQISGLAGRISPEGGAARDRHERCGEMRWTRGARQTSARSADGEVVWSWRPDAGVKSAGSIPPATVTTKPGHRGELEVSRKPLRRESRMDPVEPVVLPPCFFLHGTHGCDRHPAFPAPSGFLRRAEDDARLGRFTPRERPRMS